MTDEEGPGENGSYTTGMFDGYAIGNNVVTSVVTWNPDDTGDPPESVESPEAVQ